MRQRPGADLPEAIELGEVFNANDGVGHGKWSRGVEESKAGARALCISDSVFPVIGAPAGMGNCGDKNFMTAQKIGKVERKTWQVYSSKSTNAFPPKQWLNHDGLSDSLHFLAKTHTKAWLDFLIILGRLLGFIKCLGKKFQKVNHRRGAIFASLAKTSAAETVFERPWS